MASQRHHQLAHYREIVIYDLEDSGGFGLRLARQEVVNASLPAAEQIELQRLDGDVIAGCLEGIALLPDTFTDDNSQPLANWWWHLGKIRDKSYPAALLPVHLQAVYGGGGAVAA